MESVENIKKYEIDRSESQLIGMITPAIDSVTYAIKTEDPILFKKSYFLLTNSCNICYRKTQFEFNLVKIPSMQQFSNQDFKIKQ